MNPSKFITILGLSVLGLSVLATTAAASSYKIQKDDTLLGIIYKKRIKHIYGKSGYLQKVIKLNKETIRNNGAFIRAGNYIELPDVFDDKRTIANLENDDVIKKPEDAPLSQEFIQNFELNDIYPYSYFVLSPSFKSLKINSLNKSKFGGTDVTLLSSKGGGIDASWNIVYNEIISFFGYASIDYYSLLKSPDYNFNQTSITNFHFGGGARAQIDPTLELSSKISVREVNFLDVVSPVNLKVNSLAVTEINVGSKKTFITKKDFAAKFGGHVSGLLPSSIGSYQSNMGYGAGVSFELLHANKAMNLNYDHRVLKIDKIKNNESSLSLIMSLSFGSTL